MNENNSYNKFSSDLIVVYTKGGGFVGIKQKIFYDSFTKELTFIDERNNTFRVSVPIMKKKNSIFFKEKGISKRPKLGKNREQDRGISHNHNKSGL